MIWNIVKLTHGELPRVRIGIFELRQMAFTACRFEKCIIKAGIVANNSSLSNKRKKCSHGFLQRLAFPAQQRIINAC